MGSSESKGRYQEAIENKLGKTITNYKETILGNAILVTCSSINRTRGARNGALWSLFSIIAVAAALAFGPVAITVGSVAYAALGVGASAGIGAGIGAAIGASDPEKFYFDKATNTSLGFSVEEAVQNAYLKAFQLHKNGETEKAKGWFKTASEIFFHNCFREHVYKCNTEAINLAVDANTIFYLGKYAEAFKKFEYACHRSNNGEVTDEIKKLHAELANKKGIELFREGNFEEAANLFDAAHSNCPYLCGAKQLFTHHKRATQMLLEAQSYLKQNQFEKSVEKFRDTHEYAKIYAADLAQACLTQFIMAEEKKRVFDQANVFYKWGKTLWDKAWHYEEKGQSKIADNKFKEAKSLMATVCDSMMPNYKKFTTLFEQIKLKTEGNARYNQGFELQKQGNTKSEQKIDLLEKSANKFDDAMRLFDLGYKIEGDSRFEESYRLAEKSKLKLNAAIRKARGTNFEEDDFCFDSQTTKTITRSQTMRLLKT